MFSLVNYSDDSDSGKSDSSSDPQEADDENTTKKFLAPKPLTLPSALNLLADTTKQTAVLGNPYREAEDAKTAALEKHVKMVESDDKILLKNGKKICWNFRKGRCRFGSKCTYAHDSDIQGMSSTPADHSATTSFDIFESDTVKPPSREKKKRPGLSDTLIPSKKVLKNYSSQK